jgi:hypothetical protein
VLKVRSNIALGRIQDAQTQKPSSGDASLKGILNRAGRVLNVVELFSGAGGMGLGFLLGGGANARYRIVYSGEANPIFVASLRSNHRTYERITPAKRGSRTPPEVRPVDLRESKALRSAAAAAREAGDAQVLIGGPPCQGFSIANKNSWSGENPHNELIDVFIDYIAKLSPLVFLMENVQGILWTPKGGPSLSLVDHAERRMKAAGYRLFRNCSMPCGTACLSIGRASSCWGCTRISATAPTHSETGGRFPHPLMGLAWHPPSRSGVPFPISHASGMAILQTSSSILGHLRRN